MPHIVLTEEQTKIIAESAEGVEVHNLDGDLVAYLKPFTPVNAARIAEARRRLASSAPRIPSAQVQAHFRRLEEIRQSEGMDESKMHDLLRRMQAGEKV